MYFENDFINLGILLMSKYIEYSCERNSFIEIFMDLSSINMLAF